MRRLRVELSGGAVTGPSVMTFYSLADGPTGFPGAVKNFLNASPLMWPTSLTFNVPNTGDVIEPGTGTLTGVWTDGSALTPFSGTNTGDFAKGVGMRVVWGTTAIIGGRRVKGSTFLVPVAAGLFDVDGTIDTATVNSVQTAAAALLTSQPALAVWSRPKPERPSKRGGTLPAVPGGASSAVSATVPDTPAWLRSRRT